MEKYIGPLLLLATLAGVIWLILSVWWLFHRKQLTGFRRVVLAFVGIGALIPFVILTVWYWINTHGTFRAAGGIQDVAMRVWPTSIELMALDAPAPGPRISSIVIIYSLSILGNIGVYGAAGAVAAGIYNWPRPRHLETKGE